MTFKLVFSILTIAIISCKEVPKDKKVSHARTSIDTSKDYSKILTELEKASIEKKYDTIGELIKTISFNVKTENKKDFEDGIIPWANIENPENDLPNLINRNEIVIAESTVTIIIDYPLTNEYKFDLTSKFGFTRGQLLKEISKNYFKVYNEEEATASIKTIPVKKRTKTYNRNQTNGKYGIWGHDIGDLDLTEILVYKTTNGQIVLSLNMES